MSREFEEFTIHYEHETKPLMCQGPQMGQGFSVSTVWWTESPSGEGLHVIDARVMGMEATAMNVLTNLERKIEPYFRDELVLGDERMSRRFRAWGTDPRRATMRREVVEALDALPEVDLLCNGGRISVSDPWMKVLSPNGAMALASMNSEERIRTLVDGHERVAKALVAIARA